MTTFERLKSCIIHVIGDEGEKATLSSSLIDDLEFDSLDRVELIICAEAEFEISIDDEVLSKVLTVADAVEAVDRARAPA